MIRAEKVELLKVLIEEFKSTRHFIFTEYKGLNTEQINKLRQSLCTAGARFRVIKNRLAKIASKEAKLNLNEEWFRGPTAVIFCEDDYVKPIKSLFEFQKDEENKALIIKGGYLDNREFSPEELKEISTIPSRDELLGRLSGALISPLFKFAGGLKFIILKLLFTLKEIEKSKQTGGN